MEKIRRAWAWCWEHFGNILTIFGWVVSFGVPAWIGYITDWVSAYGPIGWLACGMAGLLTFVAGFWIYSFAREKYINSTISKTFYEKTDRINPMQTHFLDARIRLEDLLPPGTGWVTGKTFEKCDLIGPLNIATYNCIMQGNHYASVDHIMIDPECIDRIMNARGFSDCRFLGCTFYNVSFLVGLPNYDYVTGLGGSNWITLPPSGAKAAITDQTKPKIKKKR